MNKERQPNRIETKLRVYRQHYSSSTSNGWSAINWMSDEPKRRGSTGDSIVDRTPTVVPHEQSTATLLFVLQNILYFISPIYHIYSAQKKYRRVEPRSTAEMRNKKKRDDAEKRKGRRRGIINTRHRERERAPRSRGCVYSNTHVLPPRHAFMYISNDLAATNHVFMNSGQVFFAST